MHEPPVNSRTLAESPPNQLYTYSLSDDEIEALKSLFARIRVDFPDPADPAFFDSAWSFTAESPPELRGFLNRLRLSEFAAAYLVTGFPVDDTNLRPTPHKVCQPSNRNSAAIDAEYLAAFLAASLGEVFNWSTLQSGSLIQDVIPLLGEENAQSGHGSSAPLAWHTEDAFHPCRPDYLVLLGLRNNDSTPTTMASIRSVSLSVEDLDVLSQPRFHILPDDEHIAQLARTEPNHPSLARMRQIKAAPPAVAVLFGDLNAPYLRIDPVFMRSADGDIAAQCALDSLKRDLDIAQQEIVIGTGDVLIIDNYLAVHGRHSFQARHNGMDRWVKKVLVTRDLRKSRHQRDSASSRIIT